MHKINNIFFIIQNNYTKQNFYAWHIYLVNKLHNQSNIVHKHLRKKTQKKKKMTLQNLLWEMHGEFNQFSEAQWVNSKITARAIQVPVGPNPHVATD